MQKHVNLKNPSIRILVIGKTGVGKSTLVNALVGAKVAKTGDTLMGVTEKIGVHKKTKNGIHIHVCDTPGMATIGTDNSDTLYSALQECKDFDLLLFCMRMTDYRFDDYNVREMQLITKVFGGDIWKKGMIILTHANDMHIKEKEDFKFKLHEWQFVVRNQVVHHKIFDPAVVKIPIVPAGFMEEELPDRSSWISELWVQGFRRMGFEPMLYLVLLNRNRTYSTRDGARGSYESLYDQPLITCDMSSTYERPIDENHFQVLSALVGSVIGSVIGMGVGSVPMAAVTGVSFMGLANVLYNKFGWTSKETVNCFEEALGRDLIAAFLKKFPQYLRSSEYQKLLLRYKQDA